MKLIAACFLCFLAAALLFAQVATPIVTVGVGGAFAVGGASGDTPRYAAWTPSSDGGTFNGGRVFGLTNDPVSPSFHILVRELTAFDPFSINNTTLNTVNTMSDYGTGSARNCFSATDPNKNHFSGDDIWSWNGNLMTFVQCTNSGANFEAFSNSLLISPDHAAHWCNMAHYTANSNTCTSGFWSATGDLPASNTSTDIQWPTCINSVSCADQAYMSRAALVQITQDGASRPTISGVDTTKEYFLTLHQMSDGTRQLHAHRFPLASTPMVASNWTHWDGSTYQSTLSSVADIMPSAWHNNGCFAVTALYSPDFHKFYMTCSINGQAFPTAEALKPEGPWTVITTTTPLSSFCYQFTTYGIWNYKSLLSGGFSVTAACNGQAGDAQTPAWGYAPGFMTLFFRPPNVSGGARISQ